MDVHIWQLITAICAPHSTVTCMYRATSMNHTRLIFVKMNFNGYYLLLGIRLWAYLAYTMLLKDNVTYLLLCFVLFAKWHFAATIHPATTVYIGTHRSHENPKKYEEFQCQHCLIRFKEHSGTKIYADFTH